MLTFGLCYECYKFDMHKWFSRSDFLDGHVLGLHIYNCVSIQCTSCMQIEQNGYIKGLSLLLIEST